MKNKFLSSKKNQLIVCCCILGCVWFILLINWLSPWLSSWPNQQKIDRIKMDLQKAQTDYEKAYKTNYENRKIRAESRTLAANSWIESHDGPVENIMRRKINDVVEKLNFKLNSLGTVRTGKINNDFSYAEIDLTGSGSLSEVVNFLAEIDNIKPQLAWKRLDLRPDNRFRRSNTAAGSANLAAQNNAVQETRLNFNGCLRITVYSGKYSIKELKISRVAFNADNPVK